MRDGFSIVFQGELRGRDAAAWGISLSFHLLSIAFVHVQLETFLMAPSASITNYGRGREGIEKRVAMKEIPNEI